MPVGDTTAAATLHAVRNHEKRFRVTLTFDDDSPLELWQVSADGSVVVVGEYGDLPEGIVNP